MGIVRESRSRRQLVASSFYGKRNFFSRIWRYVRKPLNTVVKALSPYVSQIAETQLKTLGSKAIGKIPSKTIQRTAKEALDKHVTKENIDKAIRKGAKEGTKAIDRVAKKRKAPPPPPPPDDDDEILYDLDEGGPPPPDDDPPQLDDTQRRLIRARQEHTGKGLSQARKAAIKSLVQKRKIRK